jgi:serine/threonine-protein kinase
MSKLRAGMVIADRYELVEIAGKGAMATVWRGVSRGDGAAPRPVAVKVMKRAFAATPTFREMFLEEGRLGAELQHDNLVQVLDLLADRVDQLCLVLEWIDGIDLRTMAHVLAQSERPMPWALAAHIGIGVLAGLTTAHERRLRDGTLAPVIHRDVAPQNILLGSNGCIKLGDFGLARARDRAAVFTAPGVVKGTLSYMAPELLVVKPATPETDQFAVGCTLWEALAGERLFDAPSDAEVYARIRNGEMRPLDALRPDVPSSLVAAIHRALSYEPAERFPSARAMTDELAAILRESGPKLEPAAIVGTTVAQVREAVAARAE